MKYQFSKRGFTPLEIKISNGARKRKASLTGFTLVELLITVAIIGLMAALISLGFNTVKQKRNDARRLSDIRTLHEALGLYQTDQQVYPLGIADWELITGSDNMSLELKDKDTIQTIPLDPLNEIRDGVDYRYYYYAPLDGSSYLLKYCLEYGSGDKGAGCYEEGH